MSSRAAVEIRLLGPVAVEVDEIEIRLSAAKPRLVLALLALHAGRQVPTERLIDSVWGEEPPATARKALQVHLSTLRQALHTDGAITSSPGAYTLHAGVDVDRFEAAVERAAQAGVGQPETALRAADAALSLWGEPFADLADAEALQPERTRLIELQAQATLIRLRCLLALDRHDEVIGALDALVGADPYREDLRGIQMTALYRAGRQVDALRAFQDARRTLAEDLGVSPSPELVDLERRILDHDPSLLVGRQPVVEDATPALPSRIAGLIGRESDATEVGGLLSSARLVTLAAVAGAGKTRLAIECAHRHLDHFPHGAYFVDLTAADADADVGSVALAALGVVAGGAAPPDDLAIGFLRGRRCLVVLDNCEHVLGGVAILVGDILTQCPEVVILATSREPLGLPGERVVRLPLLDTDGSGSAAVELFAVRANEAGAPLPLGEAGAVVELCQRLDGIPLAIELAAALTRSMTPAEINERLNDRFALLAGYTRNPVRHHRTLLAALDWSHSLLDHDEQLMLRRLSVFHGGFGLADVGTVTGFDDATAARLVDALVAKSLVDVVRREDGTIGRRRLLETIRSFALMQLDLAGETGDTRDRHFAHFVGGTAAVSFQAANHYASIYDRNARELANIVAAIDHGVDIGRRAEAALAVVGVFWLLVERGAITRHLGLLDDDHDLPPEQRATLLTGRTMRAFALYDPALLPSLPGELEPTEDGEVFDDVFPVLLAAAAFAPVEGAEQRMAELDRLLALAERSSTADANVAIAEMQRAGQFYSLGQPAQALEPAARASRLSATGGRLSWDNTLAELSLMTLLGRRPEALARLAELEHRNVYELDLCRAVCAVGAADPQLPAAALARSARHHVTGRVYLQEGDYLALFAAFRFDLGDRQRADDLLDAVLIRFPVIQWLVWPHVGQWTASTFTAGNADMRARELARMSEPGWDASRMAELLVEELDFWAPTT